MGNNCNIACQKISFSQEEKTQYEYLRKTIFAKLIKIEEISEGYSFVFPSDDQRLLQDITSWLPLELKCCPFLQITVMLNHDEFLRLNLTGPPKIKDFLLHELQLQLY
jgi:hypothetical protein